MDARILWDRLEGEGFRLSLVGDGLRVEPASALTSETRQIIRENRGPLMELAKSAPVRPAPRRANDREGGDIHLGMTRLWRRELAHPDWPEALQLAMNSADAALDSLRAGGWL